MRIWLWSLIRFFDISFINLLGNITCKYRSILFLIRLSPIYSNSKLSSHKSCFLLIFNSWWITVWRLEFLHHVFLGFAINGWCTNFRQYNGTTRMISINLIGWKFDHGARSQVTLVSRLILYFLAFITNMFVGMIIQVFFEL